MPVQIESDLVKARKRLFLVEHWYEAVSEIFGDFEQTFGSIFTDPDPTCFVALTAVIETALFKQAGVGEEEVEAAAASASANDFTGAGEDVDNSPTSSPGTSAGGRGGGRPKSNAVRARQLARLRLLVARDIPRALVLANEAYCSRAQLLSSSDGSSSYPCAPFFFGASAVHASRSPFLSRMAAVARREIRLHQGSSPGELFQPSTSLLFQYLRGAISQYGSGTSSATGAGSSGSSSLLLPQAELRQVIRETVAKAGGGAGTGGRVDQGVGGTRSAESKTEHQHRDLVFEIGELCERLCHLLVAYPLSDLVRAILQLVATAVRANSKILNPLDVCTRLVGFLLADLGARNYSEIDSNATTSEEAETISVVLHAVFGRICLHRFPETKEEQANANKSGNAPQLLSFEDARDLNPIVRKCERKLFAWTQHEIGSGAVAGASKNSSSNSFDITSSNASSIFPDVARMLAPPKVKAVLSEEHAALDFREPRRIRAEEAVLLANSFVPVPTTHAPESWWSEVAYPRDYSPPAGKKGRSGASPTTPVIRPSFTSGFYSAEGYLAHFRRIAAAEQKTIAAIQGFVGARDLPRATELVAELVEGNVGYDKLSYPELPSSMIDPALILAGGRQAPGGSRAPGAAAALHGEDKAKFLPPVERLYLCFGSVFVRHLNCIAAQNIRRFKALLGVTSTISKAADAEALVPSFKTHKSATHPSERLVTVSVAGDKGGEKKRSAADDFELPFGVQFCALADYSADDVNMGPTPNLSNASASSREAERHGGAASGAKEVSEREELLVGRVCALLGDPYQRMGWDEGMVDFRVLESFCSDGFVHHVCYGAWQVPTHCWPHVAVDAGASSAGRGGRRSGAEDDVQSGSSGAPQVRDAAFCLSYCALQGVCGSSLLSQWDAAGLAPDGGASGVDAAVKLPSGVTSGPAFAGAGEGGATGDTDVDVSTMDQLLQGNNLQRAGTGSAPAGFFTCFSVSRPDVPRVPGRVRMEIDADDIFVSPWDLIHVRRIDAKGKWPDERKKPLFYSVGNRGETLLVENIRELADVS